MRIVVLIPTYNEKENIEEIIKKVFAESKKIPNIDLHVLVSDSHSPDGTALIVKKIQRHNPKVHYLDVKKRGLGIGIVKGHRYAIDRLKADILAQLDGDLSHDPQTLSVMYEQIKNGFDLVAGSRLMKGGKNKLFNKIDFNKVPWKSQTYIIQPAFLYAAITKGANIKEVPITFEDRKKGYSKAQIVAYTLDVIKFGVKVRFQKSKIMIKFLMVGGVSYLLNAFLLGLLNRGDLIFIRVFNQPILSNIHTIDSAPHILFITFDRLFVASIISIQTSIIFNFIFHENWTFKYRSREGSKIIRFLKFNLSSFCSPLIQLASILTFAIIFALHEQIGLAIGVAIGLFFNYIVNLIWIWKAK